MRVLFDDHIFTYQKYGGISRYFYELWKGGPSGGVSIDLPYLFTNNDYLQDLPLRKGYYKNSKKAAFAEKKWARKWNREQSIKRLARQDYDLFHPTYYESYFLEHIGSKPFVLTIHDMIHERLGQKFPEIGADQALIDTKRLLAEKAQRIIAVSHAGKKDIVEVLGIEPERIDVIHHGYSFASQEQLLSNHSSNYLLIVGNRGLYKNVWPYIEAIAEILRERKTSVICAGGGTFSVQEIEKIEALGLKNHIEHCAIRSDQQLRELYAGAIAFAFPSEYEGFGIPVLEAFACNCPCLLANATALPEVALSAALFFDPNNAEEMRTETIRMLEDSLLRKDLIEKGKQRLQQFSWKKTVQETIQTYQQAIAR